LNPLVGFRATSRNGTRTPFVLPATYIFSEFGSRTSSLIFSPVLLITSLSTPNQGAVRKRKTAPPASKGGTVHRSVVSPFDGANRIRFKGSHTIVTLSSAHKRTGLPRKLNIIARSLHPLHKDYWDGRLRVYQERSGATYLRLMRYKTAPPCRAASILLY
jgi:hypothetical protein